LVEATGVDLDPDGTSALLALPVKELVSSRTDRDDLGRAAVEGEQCEPGSFVLVPGGEPALRKANSLDFRWQIIRSTARPATST